MCVCVLPWLRYGGRGSECVCVCVCLLLRCDGRGPDVCVTMAMLWWQGVTSVYMYVHVCCHGFTVVHWISGLLSKISACAKF